VTKVIRSLPMASCLAMVLVSCLTQLAGFGSRPAAASPDDGSPPLRVAPLPGPLLQGFQIGGPATVASISAAAPGRQWRRQQQAPSAGSGRSPEYPW